MDKPIIMLTILDKRGKKIRKIVSRSRRRFYSVLKADKCSKHRFYLHIRYPNGGWNDGDYQTKRELIHALKAFLEK